MTTHGECEWYCDKRRKVVRYVGEIGHCQYEKKEKEVSKNGQSCKDYEVKWKIKDE